MTFCGEEKHIQPVWDSVSHTEIPSDQILTSPQLEEARRCGSFLEERLFLLLVRGHKISEGLVNKDLPQILNQNG